MARNMSDLEERMIALLKNNSRMSLLDLSKELGISRITAKKILSSLTASGTIRRFTIALSEDERNLVLVHTGDLSRVPGDLILEYFTLIDGTYLIVMYYENLVRLKDAKIMDVKIASRKTLNEGHARMNHLLCDYCGKEIEGEPITLEIQKRKFYVCCPNCERDLKRRREFLDRVEEA